MHHVLRSLQALTCLKPLTQLQQLSLARCRLLAGAAAECVTSMQSLTALSFSGCCFLDADALGHVAKGATALHTLDISGCIALAGPALNQLVPMGSLQRLSLARCFFMDSEGLRHIACLPKLRYRPDPMMCHSNGPEGSHVAIPRYHELHTYLYTRSAHSFATDAQTFGDRVYSSVQSCLCGYMPNVQTLSIRMCRHLDVARCDRLSPLHCGPLQHAAALEQLNVGDVAPMGAFRSEDWPKLSHVQVTRLPFMLEEL